jgi:hypothetical protein
MDDPSPDVERLTAPGTVPDAKDSAILLLDAVLTLLQLGRAEAAQALATVPEWLGLNFYRLPALLLTWLSFGVLVACSIYALTHSLVLAAASFFVLQLGLTLLLERRSRRLRARMSLPETRHGLAVLQASLKARFEHEVE